LWRKAFSEKGIRRKFVVRRIRRKMEGERRLTIGVNLT
jgi:hypothetical protein